MGKKPSTFKESDLRRAIVAARKAGVEIGRIRIDRSGTIELVPKSADDRPESESASDLDQWMAKHAHQTQGH
jgi:hypothetical protein